ncbi:MAG: nitroreductase family protein [Candidatus Hydrothermae bacterium]|nr:nitroreductase family protein [Candidatus Hydrothermae bacterium]
MDAALAAQNLALAAESMGYGIAFIGGIQNHPRELRDLLGLPRGVLPLVGVCVGVPRTRPSRRPRLPLEAVVHVDRYRTPDRAQLASMFEAMAPITSSGDWLDVLRRYFARGGVMEQREEAFRRVWEEQLKDGSTGRA